MIALLGAAVFGSILVIAAIWDVRSYRIPNAVCLALAVAAVAFALPLGPAAWLSRAASFGVVAAVVLVLYLLRGMGGGDVKLLAAAALWMPFPTLPTFVLALAVAGGGQAAATLVLRRWRGRKQNGGRPEGPRRRMPYALSIAAAGGFWTLATQLA